jgi:CRISPR/Cas system type I-B associated protein Csh2 (Cas7 group RAMP superfamily)
MTLALYFDHHVPRAVTDQLRQRGVVVLTAFEDSAAELDDSALLDRATARTMALCTSDPDLLAEARRRTVDGRSFGGVIFGAQRHMTIGQWVRDLEVAADVLNLDDFDGLLHRVLFLPL